MERPKIFWRSNLRRNLRRIQRLSTVCSQHLQQTEELGHMAAVGEAMIEVDGDRHEETALGKDETARGYSGNGPVSGQAAGMLEVGKVNPGQRRIVDEVAAIPGRPDIVRKHS